MNRRNWFGALGAFLAWMFTGRKETPATPIAEELPLMYGIKPCEPFGCGIDCVAPGEFSNLQYPYTIKIENPDGESLRLWLNDQFYVDLPEDRYMDSVEVDWMLAKEWQDGPLAGRYTAQCRVRPPGGDWELLVMERDVEESDG